MSSGEFSNLGKLLKESRLKASFTQSELSQILKLHSQFVSNWERGQCAPPAHCFDRVMDILGVSRQKVVEVMVLDARASIEAKVYAHKKKKNSP